MILQSGRSNMGIPDRFVFQMVLRLAGTLLACFSISLFLLFRLRLGFLFRYLKILFVFGFAGLVLMVSVRRRDRGEGCSPNTDPNPPFLLHQKHSPAVSSSIPHEPEPKQQSDDPYAAQFGDPPPEKDRSGTDNIDPEPDFECVENKETGGEGLWMKEPSPDLHLTFKFQTFDEFCRRMDEQPGVQESAAEESGEGREVQGDALSSGAEGFVQLDSKENSTIEHSSNEGDAFSLEAKGFVQFDSKSAGEHSTGEHSDDADGGEDPAHEFQCLSDGYFGSDTDTESFSSSEESSAKSRSVDSNGDAFFGEDDSGQLQNPRFRHDPLEEEAFQNFEESPCGSDDGGKATLKISPTDDSGDSGLEKLWEHDDLIQQLKMELKRVRATGLPTILEESEFPEMMEDLKPWKVEEKLRHENPMSEIFKFHRTYRERMRKFDILTYQKLRAIGVRKLQAPFESIAGRKSSRSTLLPHSFRRCAMDDGGDPTKRFVEEVYGDLEAAYVGQLCLSWEFLHWQYDKALELWESDPRGSRSHNEVAGEFQQLQVLMQRFMEDEPFQGPRVLNFVRTRSAHRSLLQIPAIRADGPKGRRWQRSGSDGEITSDVLVEILEESIRIFWRFVRADSHAAIVSNCRSMARVQLQDPSDSNLLVAIQKDLQKKEKKLKDALRTGNCLLRKLQKKHHEEDEGDQVLYFFSQVDMKLVSRVLNMSRITRDQLGWCHSKLDTINFVNRKIRVEPSFFLFPSS